MTKPETERRSISFVPAVCSVCGEYRPEEFEGRMAAILAEQPELAKDPEVEWVFVCGGCTAQGLCPCCESGAPCNEVAA
jgi:hypothetical protein